jgi:hypothetical protein
MKTLKNIALSVAVAGICLTALTGCIERQANGCDSGVLTIRQSHVKLNIKGVCNTVVIDGSYVDLESNNANREIINGDHNNVAFVPYTSLSVNGDYNKGGAAEVGTVTIHGDHNNFSFDGAIQSVTVTGNDNYLDSDESITHKSVSGTGNYVGG